MQWLVPFLFLCLTDLYATQPVSTDRCAVGFNQAAGLSKPLIGSTETVTLLLKEDKPSLRAKIDTGAKTSSLHAEDISRFSKEGVPYVRFKTGEKGALKTVELPLSRKAKVKSSDGNKESRPFVEIPFQLGKTQYTAEFSLNDRSKMEYPVLLGAEFLKGRFWVDVEQADILSKSEP